MVSCAGQPKMHLFSVIKKRLRVLQLPRYFQVSRIFRLSAGRVSDFLKPDFFLYSLVLYSRPEVELLPKESDFRIDEILTFTVIGSRHIQRASPRKYDFSTIGPIF